MTTESDKPTAGTPTAPGANVQGTAAPAAALPAQAPKAASSAADPALRLDGVNLWLVTDGTAEALGWQDPFLDRLKGFGASTVVLGVSGMLGLTARGLIGQGAERLARTLRFSRRGEPDVGAFETIEAGRPDIILADHPAVLRTLEVIRDASRSKSIHVALIGSYAPMDEWVGARADAFVGPDEGVLQGLRSSEHSDAAIVVAGPPVPRGFAKPLDRGTSRTTLGLESGLVVLIDVDGMEPQAIERTVFQTRSAHQATLLFHYGSDGGAADALRQAASRHGVRAHMFGHVDDLELYAAAADVVVLGPGNRMAGAYLAIDRPVIALDPALASVAPARSGAMVVLSDDVQLGSLLMQLQAEGAPETWSQAAEQALPDDPSAQAAAAVAQIWASRTKLRVAALQPVPTASAPASPRGRLEPIGVNAPVVPVSTPLSRAEAKTQLAGLIVEERQIEAEVVSAAADRDTWYSRLALAEERNELDLVDFATRQAQELTRRITELNERASGIRLQKEDVRRRALAGVVPSDGAGARQPGSSAGPQAGAPPASAPRTETYEERFRRMERDSQLDRLRSRAFDGDA